MEIREFRDRELKEKLKKFVYDIVGCCQAVHKEKGPELTEYVYQECLEMAFQDANIEHIREYSFHPTFRGRTLKSRLQVDFFCKKKVFVECKAIEELSNYERIQLTNYMRNAGVRIGILYNFAPIMAECEKYYYNPEDNTISYF
ncbi:MAG: GxxExxY protein [Bacteroidaceae bacterium]|nr:GxxExxY protein [Bacteroidaceae bacterium]